MTSKGEALATLIAELPHGEQADATIYIMLVNFTDQGLKGVKEVPNRQDKSRDTAIRSEAQNSLDDIWPV
jgi:hypothetical protein